MRGKFVKFSIQKTYIFVYDKYDTQIAGVFE